MENFLQMYQKLNSENLHLLDEVYATDIEFVDPAHTIVGRDKLKIYFSTLYENLHSIQFTYSEILEKDQSAYLQWKMNFHHTRLNKGSEITVHGTTFIRFNNDRKVCYHRDYFDLGELVYENLPLLGSLIKNLKGRIGS